MDRPLDYEIERKMGKRIIKTPGGKREIDWPKMTMISSSFEIDHKNRLWIRTVKKHPKLKKDGTYDKSTGKSVIEIFDKDGILLGDIPLPKDGFSRILGDRLYSVTEEYVIHEYKIIDLN